MDQKQLHYFDLKPGVEYEAYDRGRKLPKVYTVDSNGNLQNRDGGDGGELGTHIGCSWIPVKSGIYFVELRPVDVPALPKKDFINVLALEEGGIYVSPALDGMRIARHMGGLFRVDRENVPTKPLDGIKISLTAEFTKVGEIKNRLTLDIPMDQTFWPKEKAKMPQYQPA